MTDPGGVMNRLAALEDEMALGQNSYEAAAEARARLIRDWEHRLALHMQMAKGTSAEVRKANALVAAIEQDDLYQRLREAEGAWEGSKAAMRVRETRSTIGMALLKTMSRA